MGHIHRIWYQVSLEQPIFLIQNWRIVSIGADARWILSYFLVVIPPAVPVVLRTHPGINVRMSVWFQWYEVFLWCSRTDRLVVYAGSVLVVGNEYFVLYIWRRVEKLCFWLYTYKLSKNIYFKDGSVNWLINHHWTVSHIKLTAAVQQIGAVSKFWVPQEWHWYWCWYICKLQLGKHQVAEVT
jgi:hypothetical protein